MIGTDGLLPQALHYVGRVEVPDKVEEEGKLHQNSCGKNHVLIGRCMS